MPTAPPDLQALHSELARLENRAAELRAEQAATSARAAEIRREIEAHTPAEQAVTKTAKIALFRNLFRGREDVFARRWENTQSGKAGYSPACVNDLVRGLCAKLLTLPTGRRGTCSSCAHPAFLPLDDSQIWRHLRGDHVLGVYALRRDDTCLFLAADFDKAAWQDDVTAFSATCAAQGIPCAVERSRSGNGAHAWLFFDAPVAAATARQLGCFLLTQTAARRHQLALTSYDRLFPNQDTLPKGGFGNLIALPLQWQAREAGNSVFLDADLQPIPDQWAYLAARPRLDPTLVARLASEAVRKAQVLGVRWETPDLDDFDDARPPWERPPSGAPAKLVVSEPMPPCVTAVLRQRLFVPTAGLPPVVLNRLKRLAAFQNPEFYRNQKLRLPVHRTPRIISRAEDHPDHIALPRGCGPEAAALLEGLGCPLELDDRRHVTPIEAATTWQFRGQLTPTQSQAAEALLAEDIGLFVAPPGLGKTVVGAYCVAARAQRTLVLVHRKPLLDQWVAQLAVFLGLEPTEIGRIGGGKDRLNGHLDVAMIQSLVDRDSVDGRVDDRVTGYGHVIIDEAHHGPAQSFERVLDALPARYILGLTATPRRRDGLQPILHMQLGPARFTVDTRSPAARGSFTRTLLVRETGATCPPDATITTVYSLLAADSGRNDLICADIRAALDAGRNPLVLTERRSHLEELVERLRPHAPDLIVLHGGLRPTERRSASERLQAPDDGRPRLVLATGRYIGEGFDEPRLDTLFLALPIAWKETLTQYAGRLHREHASKAEVRIHDYADSGVPVLKRMLDKRMRRYRALGYAEPVEGDLFR